MASKTNSRLEELKTLSAVQLKEELVKAQKELFVLKMKKDMGELKQTHLIGAARKDIARISTFLSSSL